MLALLQVAPLLMTDDGDRQSVQLRQAGDDRAVVAEQAITVQLCPVLKDRADVVQRVGTLDMAGEQDFVPGRQIGEEGGQDSGFVVFEVGDLESEIRRVLRVGPVGDDLTELG